MQKDKKWDFVQSTKMQKSYKKVKTVQKCKNHTKKRYKNAEIIQNHSKSYKNLANSYMFLKNFQEAGAKR